MYGLDLLFFYLDTLIRDDIAKKSQLIVIKSALFEIGV